jgi:hypothetical protein
MLPISRAAIGPKRQIRASWSHLWQCACLDQSASSHSFRVGKLQGHIGPGNDIGPIAQAYAIKDPRTVMRYGTRLRAKSGAAARLAEKMVGE